MEWNRHIRQSTATSPKFMNIELDSDQKEVIDSTATHRLVVAGPGSGKSRVLVAAILEEAKKHGPGKIVAITYTNAAALEIETRLKVAGMAGIGFVGTLHAFLLRLLREHGHWLGLPLTLSVIDDEQREGMVETVMLEMGVKTSVKKVMAVLDEWPRNGTNLSKEQCVAAEYHARLLTAGALDFASILYFGEHVIIEMEARKEWGYKFLAWDEVQDMSKQDWRIMEYMPCARKYLTGDSDQAIFQFRGGDPSSIVELFDKASHPKGNGKWKSFTLESNYRSKRLICSYANRLIEHNEKRVNKLTAAITEMGGMVDVQECGDGLQEMYYVMSQLKGDDKQYAVLARTNRMVNQFSEFLSQQGHAVTRKRYVDQPADWRKAKLLLVVLANPWNDLAVQEYLAAKSTRQTAAVEKSKAAEKMVSINESMGFPFGKGDASLEVDLGKYGLSAESRERIHDACRELGKRGQWDINDLVLYLSANEQKYWEEGEGVTVTTIHGAKGKEFGTVFIVGCEDGMFPQIKNGTDLQEERRCMFVGMTRAKDRLVLTWAKQRQDPWSKQMKETERSRFVTECGL